MSHDLPLGSYSLHKITINPYPKIEKKIEKAIQQRFGWKIKFTIEKNGDFHWRSASSKNKDRYDLYPNMTKAEADKAVIQDITAIIREFLPSAKLSDYEQSGNHIKVSYQRHRT